MMLPTRTPEKSYRSLDELQQRKEELAAQIRKDNDRFGTLWNSLFSAPKDASKGEMIANIVSKSVTAIDAFLLVRKLMKNYGFLFGRKRK
ncbi:MAG: hypothetical protein II404_01780 [Prevotella sp.]|nr:hypothetical protein [Prevotella sp.]